MVIYISEIKFPIKYHVGSVHSKLKKKKILYICSLPYRSFVRVERNIFIILCFIQYVSLLDFSEVFKCVNSINCIIVYFTIK